MGINESTIKMAGKRMFNGFLQLFFLREAAGPANYRDGTQRV
jgi:hypothetical protein